MLCTQTFDSFCPPWSKKVIKLIWFYCTFTCEAIICRAQCCYSNVCPSVCWFVCLLVPQYIKCTTRTFIWTLIWRFFRGYKIMTVVLNNAMFRLDPIFCTPTLTDHASQSTRKISVIAVLIDRGTAVVRHLLMALYRPALTNDHAVLHDIGRRTYFMNIE